LELNNELIAPLFEIFFLSILYNLKMGGGLMQLVAYGAQDIYLTGNPQITFFKVVYRRHTNFSMESIEQSFNGNPDFGKKVSCTISRNGDLIHRVYLQTTLPEVDLSGSEYDSTLYAKFDEFNWVNWVGHQLIKNVEVQIGGQRIDKHYGEWMDIWAQLTNATGKNAQLTDMINGTLVGADDTGSTDVNKLYIPLQFWFNRNPGLALPLIALQYHEVKLNVFIQERAKLAISASASIDQICLYCDYVFLDTDERRRFAQVSHEYLIEQLQFNNIHSVSGSETTANIDLRFNHPCKELVWVVQPQTSGQTSGAAKNPFQYSYYTSNVHYDALNSAKLQLNGHDRFREREGTYFRCVQPYQHHTGLHRQGGDSDATSNSGFTTGDGNGVHGEDGYIYTYSFGLKPEEHQPSGTCNFSRIDNAVLQLKLNSSVTADKFVKVYTTNYNVLRVMSGMGGLAYSN